MIAAAIADGLAEPDRPDAGLVRVTLGMVVYQVRVAAWRNPLHNPAPQM